MAGGQLSKAKLARMRKAWPDADYAKIGLYRNRNGEFNAFKFRDTGKLNREYLRICAVHKLLDRGRINKARAVELLAQRKVKNALGTVELWLAWPTIRFAS